MITAYGWGRPRTHDAVCLRIPLRFFQTTPRHPFQRGQWVIKDVHDKIAAYWEGAWTGRGEYKYLLARLRLRSRYGRESAKI